jgi:tryptophan synthase alpha chain
MPWVSRQKKRKKSPVRGSERLRAAFRNDWVALIPYLTGGYPTLEGAREVGEAYVDAGADVVEIGVPFSDPLADGPTIQDTTTRALENGADLDYCLELASEFSGRVPVVFLLYYNVIFARGAEEFLREAAEAGVSGLVIPDLPVDEAGGFAGYASEAGVAFCPLVAPTSTDDRLARVGELATGFVYCVSVAGVTGVRDDLPPGAVELLRRTRSSTAAPVALGFGIGSPEAAVQAAGEADGVIIGSKLMRLVAEGGPERAGGWLGDVREALSGVERAGGRHQELA